MPESSHPTITLTAPPVDRMRIAYMTVAMRDPNPVHLEEDAAQSAGMPGVIAHGTFPLAYAGALITQTFGFEAVRNFSLQLTAPVFPGEELRVEAKPRTSEAPGQAVYDLQVVKPDGEIAARGQATVTS